MFCSCTHTHTHTHTPLYNAMFGTSNDIGIMKCVHWTSRNTAWAKTASDNHPQRYLCNMFQTSNNFPWMSYLLLSLKSNEVMLLISPKHISKMLASCTRLFPLIFNAMFVDDGLLPSPNNTLLKTESKSSVNQPFVKSEYFTYHNT